MGGRSKKHSRKAAAEPEDEQTLVRRGASVKAIKTWDDVEHDSADEFDHSRDKVLLGYDKKLAKHDGTSDFDSDEEVLKVNMRANSSSEDEVSDADEGEFYSDQEKKKKSSLEDGAWGKQKYNYYDADDIGSDTGDDEDAANEEEEEAMRLQKRQLEALDEDDFIDDFSTQLGVSTKAERSGAARLVAAVDDEQAQIDLDKVSFGVDGSYDLSDAKRLALERLPEKEKQRIIQAESPELLSLVADVDTHWSHVRLHIRPLLDRASALGVKTDDHPALAFYSAKYQLLMSYLNNIAVYLVMKASTAAERGGVELRDHPVIASIVEFRRRLEMMDALQTRLGPLLDLFVEELTSGAITAASETAAADSEEDAEMADIADVQPSAEPKKRSRTKTRRAGAFLETAGDASGDSYAELQAMLKKERAASRKKGRSVATSWEALEDGDFGEQEQLDEGDAEDKARAVRRLRHHAKRITQARAKRDTRDTLSGDIDVPYKDRRLAKLRYDEKSADATRARAEHYGDDLDSGSDVAEEAAPEEEEDDYYSQVARSTQAAKDQRLAEKQARLEAQWQHMVEANVAGEAAVEGEVKRNVNYQILKNRGLVPKRTKEQRNPRVKRRNRYEQAKKKLNSSVTQVRALEGNYGGEATGIKAHLSRSTRFK
ncbi:something about silencing protein 10 [Coemansia pectinata]|uniref:Something about silencing protein 10 n=1 Tax=Coemansia pectinata TaxID=1052879 RepID=A0A9W8GYW8_9FUNG|nr:something about silencing protein 10 [Coemansia pectinata]